jgi:DNA polymerase III subunit gamma/tau
MASQSLYRKWRSQTFDDLIGQEPIVRTLKNALRSGNVGHAYLFTGPRGTGKTSTARLLAKTINCSNPKDGEPCNECQQCREITAGNSFNVIEIDAASNRGIDSIRDLREKVMMPPSTGKYKVYVLDEAHMLTPEAFNALLKTLEEPPPYAIFVMATTDVHKMLPTVLSRCQRFDFKRITTRQIVDHLLFIAEQEHVKLEHSAAELIARSAAGGMRDALSLLDQAIAYSGEEILLAQVQAMLGVADPRAISRLITSIAELDSSAVLHLIHELSEAGADLRQINAQVVEYWRALMLARAGADAAAILDLTEDEMREVKQLSQLFRLEELTECARVFAQNDLVQKSQGTPQLGLELASLECIEVHRRAQSGQLAPPVQSRPVVSQPAAQVEAPGRLETRQRQPSQAQKSRVLENGEEKVGTSVSHIEEKVESQAIPAQSDGERPALTVQQVRNAWENVLKRTRQRTSSGALATMVRLFTIIDIENAPEKTVIVMQAEKQNHYNYVKGNDRYKDLEWALSIEFGIPCFVRLVPPGQPLPSVPIPDAATYSTSTAPTIAPQQSAYRERPVTPPNPPEEISGAGMQKPTSPLDQPAYENSPSDAATLARMNIVRENTNVASHEDTIEQKASRDPVVQEVVKTFSARIVEVHPK